MCLPPKDFVLLSTKMVYIQENVQKYYAKYTNKLLTSISFQIKHPSRATSPFSYTIKAKKKRIIRFQATEYARINRKREQ